MANITDPLGNFSSPGVVERVIVPILDTLILVIGILGHSLVILILSRKQRRPGSGGMGNTIGAAGAASGQGTDILLLSLSAADLILLACLPFHTAAIATGHWPFGSVVCKLMGFLGAVCTSASAFTLAALAVARYFIVAQSAKAYRWRRDARIKLGTVALWVPAVVLAAPQFFWRTLDSGSNVNRQHSQDLVCFNFLSPEGQLAYGVCHFLLAFALPLGVIVVAYGRIYIFLRRARQRQTVDRLERYQNQVTKTSALLVLAFALCWLPSYVFMFAQLAADTTVTGNAPRHGGFAMFARIMATSATVANPILYSFMSQKFRKELTELGQRSCKDRFFCNRPG
ncbi:delta-type opioid receptor [Clupea harengus]|uniref:Delta-type opioid receptor n=1 Tax=Clupea harengus TaxID=7950 RepID=A0A8M1KMA3_CLUHA|nr:delta-type opioid receptor [Clupea harengus]